MIIKKQIIICLFICISSLGSNALTHFLFSGGEIRYEWVSDSTWKIKVRAFSNCTIDDNLFHFYYNLCLSDTQNYMPPFFNPFWQPLTYSSFLSDGRPNGSQLLLSCNIASNCDSVVSANSITSYHLHEFERYVTLPEKNGKWWIRYNCLPGQFRRDSLITNLQHLDSNFYAFLDAYINFSDTNIKNSSAYLVNSSQIYAPLNQNFSYQFQAFDPDGDSLSYHFVQPRHRYYQCGGSNPIGPVNILYKLPFTNLEPFATNGTFNWDSTNATMSFNTSTVQNPLITIIIDEYRNGVWVGNSSRDIPIVIVPFNYALPQTLPITTSFINTVMQGVDSFYTCAGQTMSLCNLLFSDSSNAILTCNSNIGSAIPNATLTYSNIYTDSVTACLSWTPSLLDSGWHTFTITVKDTTCPTLGINTPQTFAYRIYVYPSSNSATSVSYQSCDNYIWNGQSYSTSGIYSQTLANMNGCDSIVTLNLSIISLDTTIAQSGFSLWSNAPGANYQWIDCKNNTPISGETNQGFTTVVGGSYAVIVTFGGCTDTTECKTIFSVNTIDYNKTNSIQINPNPANDKLNITCNEEIGEIKVYNLLSQLVAERKSNPTKELDIYIGNLSNGIYLVNIDGRFVRKLVVSR